MLILRFLLHIIRVLITRDIQVEGLWTIRHRIIITTETITVAIIIITEIMETGNNGNNDGNNGGKKDNHNGQMILGFIMVTLVALFFLSFFANRFSQMSSKETTYSEFLKQLEKNNVKTVEFSNYEMDYTLVDDKKPYEITYYTGIVNDPDLITTLKSAKTSEGKAIEISASVPDNTSAWLVNILSFVIPLVLIWILFGFLMRRMGGGAMGVGKSTAKVYVEKTTGVTFKDVART